MKSSIIIISVFVAVSLSGCNKLSTGHVNTVQKGDTTYIGGIVNGAYSGYGLLLHHDSVVYKGEWAADKRQGHGEFTDSMGRRYIAMWENDTLVEGSRQDSAGVYTGRFNRLGQASGHGVYQGKDGSYYEGHWLNDRQDGFGVGMTAHHSLRAGEWRNGIFKGERVTYTSERIYGIDISKHQHIIGKKRYGIDWRNLRITHLGSLSQKRIQGHVDYPISYVYIKSTEGITVRNKFYRSDYIEAHRYGYHVGAYHFFSTTSDARLQALYFLKHTLFRNGDFPPVLDVEPSHAQIQKMGGTAVLFDRVRTWLRIVGKHTHQKPILYISQSFVNRYLKEAPDIKRDYQVWIARYGEYKPDVRLVYWQLSPDGRVKGIKGEVDINVFNGYMSEFNQFVEKYTL
uniref:Glycosyl hydrolase family 25 n=1 Tax=Prevotella sp. GTC17259 TaxID=3236795 RepID=A0AB33J3Y7_9BACT